MYLTPFSSLTWAYQLHYYLCFRTNSRRQHFANSSSSQILKAITDEICERHDYHLLEQAVDMDQIRCLVSLRPQHTVSKVIQTIKSNSARECAAALGLIAPVWERGYLARSTGRVRITAVQRYLEDQAAHHGYSGRVLPPVYHYRARQPVLLTAAHAMFELNHHLVLALVIGGGSLPHLLVKHWRIIGCRWVLNEDSRSIK